MMTRRYVQLGYLAAALFVLFPLLDIATNVWPWDLGSVGWRYGGYGILSGFVLSPVVGLALAVATALAAGHRRTARALAVLAWLGGVVVALVGVVYVLDALQIRATVPAEARDQFGIGTGKALIKNYLAVLALAWIGFIGWRRQRAQAAESSRSRRSTTARSAETELLVSKPR